MWRLNIMYRVPIWALRIAAGRERNPTYDQIFFLCLEASFMSLCITLTNTTMNTIAKTANITFGNIFF